VTTAANLTTVVIYSRKKFINLPLEFSAVKSFFLVADARDNYARPFALGKVFQASPKPLSKTWLLPLELRIISSVPYSQIIDEE
jgi:hypothetical protein